MWDKGDQTHLEKFDNWAEFYATHYTLLASQENEIMHLFKYFIGRDLLLLASGVENNKETTQAESDGENDRMETRERGL